jgi:hypothetical protein
MDPISLAAAVVAALTPYAAKSGEAVAAELGKQALASGERLLKALWTRWRGNPDREARLKAFVEGAERGSDELKLALVADMASHPDFADALSALMANEVPEVRVEQVAQDVDKMTGAEVAGMIRGDIRIKQHGERVKELTGLKVGTFGGAVTGSSNS